MNSNTLLEKKPNPVDLNGGQPLAGSGFEAEEPDPRFRPDASDTEEA